MVIENYYRKTVKYLFYLVKIKLILENSRKFFNPNELLY